MVTYVMVGAADGYRVVFALPEIDPAFSDRLILLADRRDQQPLSPEEGPLRLVVPGEKRQARWVRQVTSVTIRRAEWAVTMGQHPQPPIRSLRQMDG
jgi:DMSO/TMAO reductase YedYZ molybdopterin-dependent catalytic subunit